MKGQVRAVAESASPGIQPSLHGTMQRLGVVSVLLVSGWWALQAPAAPAREPIVAPTTSVGGMSQGQWSERWWIWASSFATEQSPISDRTGARCGAGQSGPVWFLAGAFGSALVERRCSIPPGKHLFFPLVNYVVMPRGSQPLTCESAIDHARAFTDLPAVLVAVVDGRNVPDLTLHRQASPACFDLAEGARAGISLFPSAANGYYLMLSPLPPGRHTLRFGGELPGLRQAISYELTVE